MIHCIKCGRSLSKWQILTGFKLCWLCERKQQKGCDINER